jgi:hypothetical protein
MKRALVVGITLMTTLGLGPPPAGARENCRIWVSSTPTSKGHAFSATEILDLKFSVFFPGPQRYPLPASLDVKVFTPTGHLYQDIVVPVAAEGSTELTRAVRGHPFGLKVRRATKRVVVVPPFPVAGTSIVSSSLYGKWRVVAWPEGADSPCVTPFGLRP